MSSRTLETDVTVYGATGFVGRHICNYLLPAAAASVAKEKDRKLIRITLAGRNGSKLQATLERLRNETGLPQDGDKNISVDTFVADCADADAVGAMAARTRVVLNCAGPFATYGTTVLEACAKTGADYVDITGEVTWAGNMRKRCAKESRQSGSRIISFCGFDSIPSDLAVFAAVRALQRQRGRDAHVFRAKAWFSCFGFANGGTIHTALDMPINISRMIFDEDTGKMRRVPYFVDHPFHLASDEVQINPEYHGPRDQAAKSEWWNQLITINTELGSSWFHTLLGGGAVASVPFFMAPVNAKVVYASAVALGYGKTACNEKKPDANESFAYSERFLPMGFTASSAMGIFSLIPAILFQTSTLAMMSVFMIPYLGKRLALILAPPGSGIPDSVNEMGFAEVYAEAHSRTQKYNRIDRGTCRILFKGDPGNLVTAQCVSESALSLVLNRDVLPQKSKDGFGTPAELLGDVLIKRLQESAVRPITFEPGFILNDADSKWISAAASFLGICAAFSLAMWLGPHQ
mmetsp:Transcript_58479/g.174171  ORF Transcript_58479/g.174171 Transcript_58479/m.174171 type:complete len:520 (-) Transcript_58479:206-1765(-)